VKLTRAIRDLESLFDDDDDAILQINQSSTTASTTHCEALKCAAEQATKSVAARKQQAHQEMQTYTRELEAMRERTSELQKLIDADRTNTSLTPAV
jgi:hypothetical protein